METGVATLPFLDVLIHRSPGGVTFSVYRKPSHCHMYIHYFSLHAPHVKRGVLSGLFLRALRISSNEHLQPELDLLWAAFRRLGYPNFSYVKHSLLPKLNSILILPSPLPLLLLLQLLSPNLTMFPSHITPPSPNSNTTYRTVTTNLFFITGRLQ